MEPIRAPFYAGLISFVVGLGLLAIGWVTGNPSIGNARFLYGFLWGLGLLLGSVGAFLIVCLGLVFIVHLLVEPRAQK